MRGYLYAQQILRFDRFWEEARDQRSPPPTSLDIYNQSQKRLQVFQSIRYFGDAYICSNFHTEQIVRKSLYVQQYIFGRVGVGVRVPFKSGPPLQDLTIS
eukprot:TRINITY_DN3009_c0_g2_i1.p15 TRINITY_DN3009_c0_g2~~TRINITY_DN3009_c0_g2_i1.p15  ORF type:complete len:100 (-),score=5.82 TRINITY_DN3009_c0_g2_i1:3257-3556(-)